MIKFFILVFLTLTLNAVIITGEGYANTKEESLKESLADLSNQIFTNVKSDVVYGEYSKEKLIQISSSLPIIGFEKFITTDDNGLINTTTTISSENSLDSYLMELNRLNKAISSSR